MTRRKLYEKHIKRISLMIVCIILLLVGSFCIYYFPASARSLPFRKSLLMKMDTTFIR